MKHRALKSAIELAEKMGFRVRRHHTGSAGITTVEIQDPTGVTLAEKRYTTGNASGQASFIKKNTGWKLVEEGSIHCVCSNIFFIPERESTTLYQWHPVYKHWLLSPFSAGSVRAFRKKVYRRVKVDAVKLCSGIPYDKADEHFI